MKKRAIAISLTALVAAPAIAALYVKLALVAPMQARLVEQLKDPASAQFRNVKFVGTWIPWQDAMLCGEVNAKNSMGGYVGFKRFEVSQSGAEIVPDVMNGLYDEGKLKFCDFSNLPVPWWYARW